MSEDTELLFVVAVKIDSQYISDKRLGVVELVIRYETELE